MSSQFSAHRFANNDRGAFSVGKHLLAYDGRDDGLFSGAIGQSGAPTGCGPWEPNHGKRLPRQTLCTTC